MKTKELKQEKELEKLNDLDFKYQEETRIKHDWIPLCSDINTHWSDTYNWWRCANCGKDTEHTKDDQPEPSNEGCTATEKGSVFPLSSI